MVVFSGTSVLIVVLTVFSFLHLQTIEIVAGDVIISQMGNFSVNPCEDFYEYACGNFHSVFPNPFPNNTWGTQWMINHEVKNNLKKLLKGSFTSSSRAAYVTQKYFLQCLNHTWEDQLPLLNVIKEFGHWPIFKYNKNWTAERHFAEIWDFNSSLAKASKYQAFPFFKIFFNSYGKILQISKPEFEETNSSHFKNAVTETLLKLENAYRNVFEKNRTQQMYQLFQNLQSFEGNLNEMPRYNSSTTLLRYHDLILKTLDEIRDTYEITTTRELSEDEEKIIDDMWKLENELREFNIIAPDYYLQLSELYTKASGKGIDLRMIVESQFNFSDDQSSALKNSGYFHQITQILTKYNKRTVASYIIWTVVQRLTTKIANTPYRTVEQIEKQLEPDSDENKREEDCLKETKDRFKFSIVRLYADEFLERSDLTTIKETADTLKTEALNRKYNFYDNQTFRIAKVKLNKMVFKILYPEFIFDESILNDHYLYEGDYLSMNIQHFTMQAKHQVKGLGQDLEEYWPYSILEESIFMVLLLNRVYFYTGAAHKPYFYSEASPEVHYGTIGWLLAHEITHGILLNGRYYNEEGYREDWWTESIEENFETVKNCFVNFTNGMSMFGKQINGSITLSETTSDAGGLFLAYRALERLLGKEELAKKTSVQNLEITKAQTFFLTFAQTMCTKYVEAKSSHIFNSIHTFNNLRVRGTLQNSLEFAEAFNCPSGSTYNPQHKCKVY